MITAEKASVNTKRTPIQMALECAVGVPCVRRYSGQIGTISKARIISVMIVFTALSMRVLV